MRLLFHSQPTLAAKASSPSRAHGSQNEKQHRRACRVPRSMRSILQAADARVATNRKSSSSASAGPSPALPLPYEPRQYKIENQPLAKGFAMSTRFMFSAMVLVVLAGCSSSPPPPPPPAPPPTKSGVEVHAPGTDVKVGQGGVDVKAPGADVQVEKK